MRITLFLVILLYPAAFFGQSSTQDKVRNYRRANEHKIVNEFLSLLAIPNIASDNPNIRKNAAAIVEMMKQRGLSPRLLEARTPNVPPVVYGEFKTPSAQRTLVLYAHYDGQPILSSGQALHGGLFRSAALGRADKFCHHHRMNKQSIPSGVFTLAQHPMTRQV
jgi:hypothetical protein